MIAWPTVRASRIHHRSLWVNDRQYLGATLFPFFDGQGLVARVLLVDASSADLATFRVDQMQARIPAWGAMRLIGSLDPLSDETIDELAPLWHFDPWWLLKDPRFDGLWFIPVLKQTNCADAFEQRITDVSFSPTLTHVRRVSVAADQPETHSKRFRPEMLPARETEPMQKDATGKAGWVLDPFWE